MKTRYGFVSNSSSTSFCIYGVSLDCNKWDVLRNPECWVRIMKKMKQEFPADFQRILNDFKGDDHISEHYKDQIDVMEKIDEIKISDAHRCLVKNEEDMYADLETARYLLGRLGLDIIQNWDTNEIWVGRPWCSIKDDQTGKQFKLEIEELIHSLFDEECSTIEEAWYN